MHRTATHLRNLLRGPTIVLLCLASTLVAGAEETGRVSGGEFVRFIEEEGEFAGQLQTAIASYTGPDGVQLDLVAAVHLADADYYRRLNDYFPTRDAVLYELVADENVRPNGTQQVGGGGALGFIQTSMSRFLGLAFQLDSINYDRPNFVHADLEPDEFQQLMADKGETMLSQIIALVLAEMTYQEQRRREGHPPPDSVTLAEVIRVFAQPDSRDGFKYLLGKSLVGADGMFSAANTGGITILHDRNEAALEALRISLADPDLRRISIFYGAAHMPGLEQGIQELGFELQSSEWLTAWQTRQSVPDPAR